MKSPTIKPARRIGIIGGSGLYQLEGLTRQKWVKVNTPLARLPTNC